MGYRFELICRSSGVVEIVCPHGVGHPSAALTVLVAGKASLNPIHGCDHCCATEGWKRFEERELWKWWERDQTYKGERLRRALARWEEAFSYLPEVLQDRVDAAGATPIVLPQPAADPDAAIPELALGARGAHDQTPPVPEDE
jgi:hypothetical protein